MGYKLAPPAETIVHPPPIELLTSTRNPFANSLSLIKSFGYRKLITDTSFATDPVLALLSRNKTWAERISQQEPALLPALATGQKPEILWIGCSDSRVPETTLLDLKPGDVFVHRNIANVLHPGDLNSQCVILYAVEHLKVKHVILCGHIGCGGVNAALDNKKLGLIDTWLLPIRLLRKRHIDILAGLTDAERAAKLVELNVQQGVRTLKENASIIDAIRERGLQVHGMIYDVGTGNLHEVDCGESEEEVKARISVFETYTIIGNGTEVTHVSIQPREQHL